MRFMLVLLPCLFLSALLHAQTPSCSGCAKAEAGPLPQGRSICLSRKELAAHIATSRPVAPPGLNEPHMKIDGTVTACLCFAQTGKVTQVNILSGPAMMQQSVLESIKDWTFRPVNQAGRRYGSCGTLRLHVILNDSHVSTTIEAEE
ncbi:MAG: hypothetical protein ABR990_03970 [Terracidiphilus sp.]|jgi:hypothetical protein